LWPSQRQIFKRFLKTLHQTLQQKNQTTRKMGLCASKDKKEKVIEGEVANGEPNGTATAAGAGGDGCVSRGSGTF